MRPQHVVFGLFVLFGCLVVSCADIEPEVTRLPKPPTAMDPLLTTDINEQVMRLAADLASQIDSSGRRLALSTYPRTEGYVDSEARSRVSRLLEESLAVAVRRHGNYVVGRASLASVIESLEGEGLGGNIEAFRIRLLENALADIVVVPTYSNNNKGMEVSLIALETRNGNALSSSGPIVLPIGPNYTSWKEKNNRATNCFQRRQSSCILDCVRNYNYSRSQCINVLCSFESDINMNRWRRICSYALDD